MNAAGYRKVEIEFDEEICERLEHLQQTIINSNTGEEAIDNGEVPNFTAQQLIKFIIKAGTDEIQFGSSEVVYDEDTKEWKMVRSNPY